MTNTLTVRLVTPQGQTNFDAVLSVSSKNTLGNFDVLPQHANFLTIIENEPIIIRLQSDQKTLRLPPALLHVNRNTVKIFTGFSNLRLVENLPSKSAE